MGKTKIKTIDDSIAEEKSHSAKVSQDKKPLKRDEDSLVAKLKEELGIKEKETAPVEKIVTSEPGKSKPRSKKYLEATKNLDRSKTYPLPEALDMVKKLSYAKFNATLDISINTVQTGLRGLVSLPFASGKTEYKTEPKAPVIHLALGKLNQPNGELEANIKILLSTLGKTKIKKVTLSPTMGPGVKLDLTSI